MRAQGGAWTRGARHHKGVPSEGGEQAGGGGASLGALHFGFRRSAQLRQHCDTFTFGVVHKVGATMAGLSTAWHNLDTAQGFSDADHGLGAMQGCGDARHGLGVVRSFGDMTGFGTAQVGIDSTRNLEAGRGHGMGYSGRINSARSLGTGLFSDMAMKRTVRDKGHKRPGTNTQ